MNQYDDPIFFEAYSNMTRSKNGLQGAGEWHDFQQLMPNFKDKKVLDLGCGYGWHCRYAIEQGAREIKGIDGSLKMLAVAQQKNAHPQIQYECCDIENFVFEKEAYDIVFSSLVLHYLKDYPTLCKKVHDSLRIDGTFIFSVEHPIFTAQGKQDWIYNEKGEKLYWPVDAYFDEGKREAVFLNCAIEKQHRTLTTYLMTLIECGFVIEAVVEPTPDEKLLELEGMKDEVRRPMMLLIKAKKVKL